MGATVTATDDPGVVLARAGEFLAADPVPHNLILTLLAERLTSGEPGRYWWVALDGRVAGVALQSPLGFTLTLTPMPAAAVDALAGAIAGASVTLPGVNAEAATAARFAGAWTERVGVRADPVEGQRLYEAGPVRAPGGVDGAARPAGDADRDLLAGWMAGFRADTGEAVPPGPAAGAARPPSGKQFWIWEAGGPVSAAALTPAAAGVVRVGPVYTPPECRKRGYAAACVATLTAGVLARGERCVLYTQLANPTANAIYRRIGYRAVAEHLRYAFG